jgi:hypothetical protein
MSYISKPGTQIEKLFNRGFVFQYTWQGWYMVTYSKYFAKVLHQSIIYQGLVLFLSSLCLTGVTGFVALGLAVLAIYLTWTFAIGFTLLVAMIVPYLSSFALPFIASPWMVIGLYGAPALCGALLGHRFGRDLLVSYLADTHVKIIQRKNKETPDQGTQEIIAVRAQSLAQWEAERWLFKAGILQWMLVLGLGTWVKAGSSYLALAWVVGPTVACELLHCHRDSSIEIFVSHKTKETVNS